MHKRIHPSPGPQKGEGETASPAPVCVCAGHHGMCRGSLGRGHSRRRRRREIFPRIPTGRVVPFTGWFGDLFCRLSFFFLSRSGRHESMETGRTRERGDSSFNCCPVLSLLAVGGAVRSETPALQWRVREGARGGTYRTRCFHFHFSIFSSPSSSIHALLGKQPPLPSIVWSGGRLVWIRTVFPRMMESFDAVAFFLFWDSGQS